MTENTPLTVGDWRNLAELNLCRTRDSLRKAWLALSPSERASLSLASHDGAHRPTRAGRCGMTPDWFALHAARTALIVDFLFTVRFWLVGMRPHPARRYLAIVGLLSVEAALITKLTERLRRTR